MKISSNSIIINIDSTILSKEECKLLENEIIGGVILFDHNYENVEQTISLIDSIKSINLISSVISNSILEGKQLFAKRSKRPNSPARPKVNQSPKTSEQK